MVKMLYSPLLNVFSYLLLSFVIHCSANIAENLRENDIDWKLIQLQPEDLFRDVYDEEYLEVPIDLDVSSPHLCVFDSLNIHWRVKDDDLSKLVDIKAASLIVLQDGATTGLQSSLGKVHSTEIKNELDIRCVINDLFCKPRTKDIVLSPGDGILTVEFDQDTTQPVLPSREEIDFALSITPNLQHNATSVWKDARRLELRIDPLDTQNIIDSYHAGKLTEVQVKRQENITLPTSGFKAFRFLEHGNVRIFAMDSVRNTRLSRFSNVQIELCSNQSFIPSTKFHIKKDSSPLQAMKEVKSSFKVAGMFPISGNREIVVSSKAVPAINYGSWSVCMWIKLVEGPTGTYRSILFKGSPESGYTQRTPSVWLLPNSNHLTIRVSTESNPDTEINSNFELPINEWVHLCMVFTNTTYLNSFSPTQQMKETTSNSGQVIITPPAKIEPISPEEANFQFSHPYKTELYINGILDLKANYLSSVLANNASIMFFKDKSFLGPKSFIQGLEIFEGSLSHSKILELYSNGVKYAQPIDSILSILEESENSLLPFIKEKKLLKKTTEETEMITILNGQSIPSKKDGSSISQGIKDIFLKKSEESINQCESYMQRLDIHAESSEFGITQGLMHWSKLLFYGFEIPNSKCGFSLTANDIQLQRQQSTKKQSSSRSLSNNNEENGNEMKNQEYQQILSKMKIHSIQEIDENIRDISRAVYGFLLTIEEGNIDAIFPLSLTLLHGIGLESLIYYQDLLSYDWDIPLLLIEDFYFIQIYQNPFRKALGKLLIQSLITSCQDNSLSDQFIGYSSLCQPTSTSSANLSTSTPTLTDLSLGLMYFAALYDVADAHVALAYRYEHGIGGVISDIETAAQYSLLPADVASNAYHTVGAQPVVEADRIDDNTEPEIAKGNQGNDDELIQYQKIRADEGDVPSMLAMGDLYYYGARGLPRDQSAALHYFNQAANLGDTTGMCGAAAMYLKGEGTPMNVSKAIELFENATRNGSVRAYNGLGYLYFYGSQVPKNESKAYEYFRIAASYENDGDALFNTAFCLDNGIGVEKSLEKAVHYYALAAKKTGHFDSVKAMAMFHMEGKVVPRSSRDALIYLNAAKGIGPWMGWIRRGLDLYLASKASSSSSSTTSISSLLSALQSGGINDINPIMKSLMCYLYAGELGYEVAQSNAGYILRTKLITTSSSPSSSDSSLSSTISKELFAWELQPTSTSPSLSLPADQVIVDEESSADAEKTIEREKDIFQEKNNKTIVLVNNWYSKNYLFNRLLFHQYLLSGKLHLQMDNIFYLGNCYFHNRCGFQYELGRNSMMMNNKQKAISYYQLSSYGKNPVASAYLGMMYHFNLMEDSTSITKEETQKNLIRANRYYEEVLKAEPTPNNQQLFYFVRMLHSLLSWRSSLWTYPVHAVMDNVMRWFWT